MEQDTKSSDPIVDRCANLYFQEFLPYQDFVQEYAHSKILDKKDLVFRGILDHIQKRIPEGDWKDYTEKLFSFELPSEIYTKQESQTGKKIIWKILEGQMNRDFSIMTPIIPIPSELY